MISRLLVFGARLLGLLPLWLGAPEIVWGQESAGFQPHHRPVLEVTPVNGSIQIDGNLEDAGWTGAARATGFAEVEPGDQTEPPVRSEAWITYDDLNLYVAFIAYDRPEEIRTALRERDQIWTDDYIGLILDTYGDLATAYELFVNPLGVQGDLRMLGGEDEDISMDLVWNSRGMVTRFGYQVEIAIPFSSLRFPERPEQIWRVNFWRDHPRESRRQYAWAAIDRDDPCYLCNWGTMNGIRGIRPGRDLDVIASVTGVQDRHNKSLDPTASPLETDRIDGEASLNLRYGLSSDANAEVTLNPDFSQIESDAGKIDINNPFAIFYPERRPFFQDGSDLFSTPIPALYTRSINNPAAAAKLTGRRRRTAFAYAVARDQDSPVILPLEERSYFLQGGKSVTNLIRLRRTYGENSYLGGLLSDRRMEGGGSGSTFGIDGTARFLRNYRLKFQALVSRTEEPNDTLVTAGLGGIPIASTRHTLGFDGERFWGKANYTSLERDGRRWDSHLDYREQSPTFRADNGFVTRTDFREAVLGTSVDLQPNHPWLRSWNAGVSLERAWDFDGRFREEWLVPTLSLTTKRQTTGTLEARWDKERFRERVFEGIRLIDASTETRWSEVLGTTLAVRTGRAIHRSFSEAPVLGRILELDASASIHPTDRVLIEPGVQFSRMRSPDDRSEIFDGQILHGRLTYQFTRALSTRLVVEYDSFDRRVRIEPLLTLRQSALTVFYFGMSGNEVEPEPATIGQRRSWTLDSIQIFAKFQYYCQL